MTLLARHWQQTWNELGASPPRGWMQQVLDAWDEPHRHYHSRDHLEACLQAFEPVSRHCRHPGEVALALWFHDVVYDTHSSTNEADSADLAERAMFEAGITGPMVGRIRSLILSSGHVGGPATSDEAVLRDIDILVLGAAPEHYAHYQQGIRAEYHWVPEETFREGRRKVLDNFLRQDRIYQLPEFHGRFEAAARRNLQRELRSLTQGKSWFSSLLQSFS
ncbi:putative metal-dependent HD superfamily phosphohydrolase [Fluviicoccus keumensis]|uniref:Putative metal-dependent HD superfamily phosphohydrolase n=1 Tax=Fluviicoccus keumensis TaxID=1435465 RepID=A0A4Q7ZCX3_9GAMM|nr:N-methyl-D-aspartate receptor NMDAR2C subunit [Fluviicoccus keumensis]RZU48064.1 putative metal-dependent HD superfamily phosphohydrolase [Fluviicoccus keumensis]